ncbi:hypothetical protein [Robiginitomaculum antarcticum]|uniref:hypothetical protein n=1 Tax=Robiginitomaculum antarcticum TaxID=437507 RepID=UPI0012EA6927|nr:hypothetical protein [Robiginitomaculum antarcticum]
MTLVPLGALGIFIFLSQMGCILLGTIMLMTQSRPDEFPAALNSPRTGIMLIAVGIAHIFYSLIFKTDYAYHD